MSMRYPGGLIATSPVNARYPSGVWTQAQAAPYQAQNVWTRDQFWPNTTLLLQGDGAVNGAQNNTFLDSSSNNFTITRNGNTTQGSFTPYEQDGYWSNYFNSGDYLSIGTTTAFSFGTGDFTVEGWVFGTSDNIPMFDARSGNTATPWVLNVGTGTNTYFYDGSSYTSSIGITLNQWNHVAVSRASGTLRIFVNGVQGYSAAHSVNLDRTAGIRIGQIVQTGQNWTGYFSNLRIVKGTAVYTAAFTPSAAPLTAITNTSLLTCQSNRFKDNSTNNFTISTSGSPSVQAFQPFPGATTWSASVLGGSGYFDGSGDYLTAGTTSSFNFLHNSTALFTIEAWVYCASFSSSPAIFGTNSGASGEVGGVVWISTGAQLRLLIGRGAAGSPVIDATSSGTVPTNQWVHIAVTYDQSLGSSNCTFYINGVSAGTANKTGNTPSSSNSTYPGTINGFGTTAGAACYLSNVRVSNSVVYSGAFTPPTAPFTQSGALLLNFTNAGIFDAAAMNDLETVGNAQVSTSVVKYGTGSMYFDGSGDRLVASDTPNQSLGTGPFTIEMWVYPTNVSPATTFAFVCKGTSSATGTWQLDINSSSKLRFQYDSASEIVSSASLSVNVWTHVAVVREGTGTNQTKLYINGVNDGLGTVSSNFNTTAILKIGQNRDSSTDYPGYIDDLRITKGAARYITNFTPPPARMPGQ